MSKSDGNIFQLRGARPLWARGGGRLPDLCGHYRQPLAFGRRADGAGRGAGRADPELGPRGATPRRRRPDASLGAAARGASSTRWPMTSTRPRRWPRFRAGREANRGEAGERRRRRLREMLELARARAPLDASGGGCRGRGRSELIARAGGGAGGRDFERADEIRDELAELGWEVRDAADGPAARAADADGMSATAAIRSARRQPVARGGRTGGHAAAGRSGSGGQRAETPTARGAGAALRVARPPGRRRRGRALSLRRPGELLRGRTRCSSRSTRSRTRATSAPSAARPSSPAPPAS